MVKQAVMVSLGFWALAAAFALVASLVGDESFGDYFTFVALILLGLALLISAPIANRLTAFEARVWTGSSYEEETRTEAGGLSALGLLVLMAPQVAIVALLLG